MEGGPPPREGTSLPGELVDIFLQVVGQERLERPRDFIEQAYRRVRDCLPEITCSQAQFVSLICQCVNNISIDNNYTKAALVSLPHDDLLRVLAQTRASYVSGKAKITLSYDLFERPWWDRDNSQSESNEGGDEDIENPRGDAPYDLTQLLASVRRRGGDPFMVELEEPSIPQPQQAPPPPPGVELATSDMTTYDRLFPLYQPGDQQLAHDIGIAHVVQSIIERCNQVDFEVHLLYVMLPGMPMARCVPIPLPLSATCMDILDIVQRDAECSLWWPTVSGEPVPTNYAWLYWMEAVEVTPERVINPVLSTGFVPRISTLADLVPVATCPEAAICIVFDTAAYQAAQAQSAAADDDSVFSSFD